MIKQYFKNRQYNSLINKSIINLYDASFVKQALFIKRYSEIIEYNFTSYSSFRGALRYNHSNKNKYSTASI